jgi:hypothetical protein
MRDALRTYLLVSIVAVGLSGCGSPEVEPRELFVKAAQAVEATPAVRYRFEASVVGPNGERRLEGEALPGDELHNQVARGSLPAFAVLDPEGNWVGAGTGYYGEGSERYMAQLIERALATLD